MSSAYRLVIAMALLIVTLACGLIRKSEPSTAAIQPSPAPAASDTPLPTAAVEATSTAVPTEAAAPSDTPPADSGSMPAPFANLSNVSQYFNPVGQPVPSWNGIPIMPEAIAGQEFKPGQLYSFKAAATIAQAVDFYQAKLPALGYTSFMPGPATGSAGTGANAIHNSFLYMLKGSQMLLIYIASYDSDPSHVSVVISTQ